MKGPRSISDAILGISAFYHDSAAALIVDGEILAAAHEERFTRQKQDSSFPHHAVAYVLDEAGDFETKCNLAMIDLEPVAAEEEVMRKLEEIKKLYGGGNGGPIIDVTPEQVTESTEYEEKSDAGEARDEPVPQTERKSPKLPYYPD